MTNLDNIFKNRDITLLTKVPLVKAMVFPVVLVRSQKPGMEEGPGLRIWRAQVGVPL